MTCTLATLKVIRPGKGLGQRTVLRRFDKHGTMLGEHTGPRANAVAGSLRRMGVSVIRI
jgi:hypothetical protein